MNTPKAVALRAVMGKIASIAGYAVGIPSLLIIIIGLTDWETEGARTAVMFSIIILAPCIFLIYKGIQIKKRVSRFKKYDSIILTDITPLENIAARTSQSVDFVRTDLQKMIKKKFFINAHIDMSTDKLVITGRSSAASSWEHKPLRDGKAGCETEAVSCPESGALNENCIEYKVTKEDYISAIKNDLKKNRLLGFLQFYLALYLVFFIFGVLMFTLYLADAPAQIIVLLIVSLPIACVLLAIRFSRRSQAARIVEGRLKRGEVDAQYFGLHRLELMEDGIEHQYGTISVRLAYAGILKVVEYLDGIIVCNSQMDIDIIPSTAFWDARHRGAFLNNLQAKISQAKNVGVSNQSMEEHTQDASYVLEYSWDEESFITAMIRASRLLFKTRLGWTAGQIIVTVIGLPLCFAGIGILIRAFMEMSEFQRQYIAFSSGGICLGVGLALLSPLLTAFNTPFGKKVYRRQIHSGAIPGDYFSPQSLCLKEDRITERRSMSSCDVLYDTVCCVGYDSDGMYILLKGRRIFVIPNSAFSSDAQKLEIANYIDEKTEGRARRCVMQRENHMLLKKRRWPLSVYFLIIGAVLIFGAGYHAWKTIDFYYIKESAATEAMIADIETIERRKADRHNVYVSFVLDDGNIQTSLLDTYVEGMTVGDTMKIIYNKNNPNEIILWWSSPLLVAVFGGIGLLIISVTLIVRKNVNKQDRHKS